MLEFFQTGELDTISPSTETLLNSILDGDKDIRRVDTEFAGSILLQIAFRNARGKLVYKRTVDYGITVKELYERAIAQTGPFNFVLGAIEKFHGPPSLKLTGESKDTSTLEEIFAQIEKDEIIQPKHKITEWSMGRCDYRYIYAAAEKAGFTHLMPSVENSICCIRPLRKAMPGLFSFSLPILFYMIDPNSPLVLRAHVADVDTLMFSIVEIIFALMYFGRRDEFLPYWEKHYDEPGGWTEIFFKEWTEKQSKDDSNSPALTLSTVSSKKRKSTSAGTVIASKKTRTQPANTKSLPKKVNTKLRNRKAQTKVVASGSTSKNSRTKVRTKPLAVPNKQRANTVPHSSADQEELNVPEARQSSRTKAPVYYGGAENEDDSDAFTDAENEADDESD